VRSLRHDPDAADELIYVVPTDGIVHDVVGLATIASLMHIDKRTLATRRECDELREQLIQLAEQAVDLLAARVRERQEFVRDNGRVLELHTLLSRRTSSSAAGARRSAPSTGRPAPSNAGRSVVRQE
jgi:hypothetical protein